MGRTHTIIAALFAWAASLTPAIAVPAEHGSGPYPAIFEQRAGFPNHVVYRPRQLPARTKLGVYVWGNGGCSADGTSSRNHLLEIASHGYLVIAAGTIPAPTKSAPASTPAPAPAPAPGAPPPGPLAAQTATSLLSDAINWAVAENSRASSPLEGHIATDQIAVSGWSCGGLQALSVASDPRVKTAVIMNSGFFPDGASPIGGVVSDKALLARLHTPVLYLLGGPTDIAFANGSDDFRRITQLPAALVNIPVGHGGTYTRPHGGVGAEVVTAWLDWQLKGLPAARARFVGADCSFCHDARLTLERKNLR